VKSGYKIQVTVHENRGPGVHLDLGQFTRTVRIASSVLDQPLEGRIVGEVKGGVEVRTSKGTGRIDFGTFKMSQGTRETAWITTEEPGVQFEVDHVEPEGLDKALEIKLRPSEEGAGKGTRYDLTIRVHPNELKGGSFPEHSAVVVRIKGDQIRRIRIPLYGKGYVTSGSRF
jgi:hypothetical protein